MIHRYLLPQWPSVLLLGLLLLGSTSLSILAPQLLARYISLTQGNTLNADLLWIGLAYLGIALCSQVLTILDTVTSERVGWTATNQMRHNLTAHLLGLDMSFYKDHLPGELIERVDGDISAMATFFARFVVEFLGNLLLLLGILLVLTIQCWQAGSALLLFSLFILALMVGLRKKATPAWERWSQANADHWGYLEERLGGLADIRSSGADLAILRRFYDTARTRTQTRLRAQLLSIPIWSITYCARSVGFMLAFGLMVWSYQSHTISLGVTFLIYYYVQAVIEPINALTNQIDDLQRAGAGFARVNKLFSIQSRLVGGPGFALIPGACSVEFANVAFGYDEEHLVLHEISFALRPGSVLGLLGRTGSGKTTLTRLLLRLYDPTTGSIKLGGRDLREARLEDLRQQIGVVTQQVELFQASIRENLTFFDAAISDERILAVLETLGLSDWLQRLPAGLDTQLGPQGSGLSAGEAQLLAFARIYLKDPALVILDEASSRLDPVTEHLLERAVEKLLSGRTAIIIAHRLNTVKRADEILILEDGRVCEYGPREQLLQIPDSRFVQLLQTSLLEVLA